MRVISLHSGATSGEIVEPQFAIAVMMSAADCETVCRTINALIARELGDYDETFVIWFELSNVPFPETTDPDAPKAKKGMQVVNTQDLVDYFVKLAVEE